MDEAMTDATALTGETEEMVNNRIINEEYKIWKKNAVFLYDIMYSRALEWPTLTCQWLPDVQQLPDKNFSTHRMIIGTHTSGSAQDYLQIAHINYPNRPPAGAEYDPDKEELGGHGASKERIDFTIPQKMNHPGEVNKARYMWQNPDIIATMCVDGRALVFDRTKHPLQPKDKKVAPQIELAGHELEGFGLDWNKHNEGQLATSSRDKTVRIWDIKDFSKESNTLAATRVLTYHDAEVNDVQFHPEHGKNLLGSVSDDKTFQFFDLRSNDNARAGIRIEAHSDAVNTLAFHPTRDSWVVTGSADKTIGFFDIRYGKLHAFEGHKDMVTKVEWSPHDSSILASGSDDRRIIIWDLSRVGMEQTPADADDGPPEMLFMHGGQTARVSDFSWNPHDPWVMCSVAEDNLLQAWRPARALVESSQPAVLMRDVQD